MLSIGPASKYNMESGSKGLLSLLSISTIGMVCVGSSTISLFISAGRAEDNILLTAIVPSSDIKAFKSAPTYPGVSLPIRLKSTSGPNFISVDINSNILVLAGASGTGRESSVENLPRRPASKLSALVKQLVSIIIQNSLNSNKLKNETCSLQLLK